MKIINRRPTQFVLNGITYIPKGSILAPKERLTIQELGSIKHDSGLKHVPRLESILARCDYLGNCSYKYGSFNLEGAEVVAVHYASNIKIEPVYDEKDTITSGGTFRDKEILSLLENSFNPVQRKIAEEMSPQRGYREPLNIYGLEPEYVTLRFREFVRLGRPRVIGENRTIVSRFKKK